MQEREEGEIEDGEILDEINPGAPAAVPEAAKAEQHAVGAALKGPHSNSVRCLTAHQPCSGLTFCVLRASTVSEPCQAVDHLLCCGKNALG